MRKTRIAAVLITVLATGAGLNLWAQGPRGPHGPNGPNSGDPGARMERALERLDLTDAQRDGIEAILTQRRGSLEADMGAMRDARQRVGEAIHAETFDEGAIRAAAAEVAALEADAAVERGATLAAVRAELTPEQRAELETMLSERQERREQRRPRGPRGVR